MGFLNKELANVERAHFKGLYRKTYRFVKYLRLIAFLACCGYHPNLLNSLLNVPIKFSEIQPLVLRVTFIRDGVFCDT